MVNASGERRKGVRQLAIDIVRELKLFCALVIGMYGSTLSGVVRQIERAHFRNNVTLRAYRYNPAMRLMRWIARHPFLSVLVIAAIYGASTLVTWWEPIAGPAAPDGIRDYFRDFQAVNAAVLGAQATFIGLVFPLVIAFVGLLNQGRASFATRLTIYVDETAALFVGASSLLLCVAIVAQMPLAALFEVRVVAAAAMLNIVWFCLNVAALAFFVFKTLAYLHPATRIGITKSYVANVAWRRELLDIVVQNRWTGAAHYGYLPSGEEVAAFKANGINVWYSALFDGAEPVVIRRVKRTVVLKDVRFSMLGPIVRHWLERAGELKSGSQHDLIFPMHPNTAYKGDVVLARASLDPGAIARWGIATAISLKRDRQDPAAIGDTARLLKEMIADLIALIDARQADEFGAQLTLVTDLHAFLFAIAQSPGEDFNYSQMETGLHGVLGTEWTREYRELQRRSTERLPEESEFFGRCAYIAAYIYGRIEDDEITPAGLKTLLRLPHNLFFHLSAWAINEWRAEGFSPPGPGDEFALRRREDAHAAAWRSLVAGWERLFEHIAEPVREKPRTWADFRRFAPNIREHLTLSALMVGRSAWAGDRLGVQWSSDLLMNWMTHAERNWDAEAGWWAFEREELTLEALDKDWASVSANELTPLPDLAPSERAVFAGILQNAWRDHIVAIVAVCAHWCLEFGVGGAAGRAARMLIQNKRHDRGDDSALAQGRMTPRDLLAAMLRMVGGGRRFSETSYAHLFEQVSEDLDGLREAPWISMRFYSSSGGLSFSGLHVEHALMLMAAGDEAQLDAALQRMVTSNEDDILRRREEYLKQLARTLDEKVNADEHGALFVALSQPDTPVFAARLESAKQLVRAALDSLNEHRLRAIQSSPVDPKRLNDVARYAASDAFSPKRFPLNMFGAIEMTSDDLISYTLRIGNQDKGAYTDPQMAQPISNEEEWWRHTMEKYVASVTWRDVLDAAPFEALEGRTPEAFWASVRDSAAALRELGHEPILVVGSITEPRWLYDWRVRREDRHPKPADLTINREADRPDGYEFSLNETPIFRGQSFYGEAYLIPRALLKLARFHRYDNGLCVDVRFQDDPNDAWRGTLLAEFQHVVELETLPTYKILFGNQSAAEPKTQE